MDSILSPMPAFEWKKSPLAMTLDPEARAAACRDAIASGRATPKTEVCFLESLFWAEHFDEAIAFADQHPRPAGSDPAWDVALIHVLLGAKRLEEALAWTDAALAVLPRHERLRHERAELLARLNRWEEAEAAIITVLEQSGPRLTPAMSTSLRRNLPPARLLDMLDRWPDRFLPGIAPWLRVQSLLALGRQGEALEWMDVDALLHQETLSLPDVSDTAAFHAALVEETIGTASFRHEPFNTTTRKGLQSSVLLNGTTRVPLLLSAIRGAIGRYAARLHPGTPFARSMPKAGALDAWMVRLGPGGRQATHLHPSGWLSGVYYVTAPEVDETAGALVIPCGDDPVWPLQTLVPEVGKLALFPSYFKHYTLPHRSEQPRICVAFDVLPRGETDKMLR